MPTPMSVTPLHDRPGLAGMLESVVRLDEHPSPPTRRSIPATRAVGRGSPFTLTLPRPTPPAGPRLTTA
jgi:hypothetical protein